MLNDPHTPPKKKHYSEGSEDGTDERMKIIVSSNKVDDREML
jgi:hypothetical protein